jgi:hypothetical protein
MGVKTNQTEMNVLQIKNPVSVATFYKAEQKKMHVKKIALAILFVSALLAGIAAYHAPRFLVYADKPVKSDAVILFFGNNSSAREKEAKRLVHEGYARFLITPAYHQVVDASNIPLPYAEAANNAASRGAGGYPGYYEKTHLEVLYAKQTMHAMGLKSAIMVSAPYHMKRIKMICEKTFGEQARSISYVPTRYEKEPIDLRAMDWGDWVFVIREYVKICWFSMYFLFI